MRLGGVRPGYATVLQDGAHMGALNAILALSGVGWAHFCLKEPQGLSCAFYMIPQRPEVGPSMPNLGTLIHWMGKFSPKTNPFFAVECGSH